MVWSLWDLMYWDVNIVWSCFIVTPLMLVHNSHVCYSSQALCSICSCIFFSFFLLLVWHTRASVSGLLLPCFFVDGHNSYYFFPNNIIISVYFMHSHLIKLNKQAQKSKRKKKAWYSNQAFMGFCLFGSMVWLAQAEGTNQSPVCDFWHMKEPTKQSTCLNFFY